MDHVSDTFLETNVPLLVLIEAAKAGDERGVEEYAQVFMEHANKLVEVGRLFFIIVSLFIFCLGFFHLGFQACYFRERQKKRKS